MSIKWTEKEFKKLVSLRDKLGATWENLVAKFPGSTPNRLRKAYYRAIRSGKVKQQAPKILVLDIETLPLEVYAWGTWDQNVALNQIINDWSVLSWAAKFVGSEKIYYQDTRDKSNPRDDSDILQGIWDLMNEADIILGQNSKKFDVKKLNARFLMNGMKPPSSYRQIDTLTLAKKYFAFTSNKLEYMSNKLCSNHKKLTHRQFPGFELWKECLAGNQKAFKELEAYNIEDVLATEELYNKLAPWGSGINLDVYDDSLDNSCSCGSKSFKKNGFVYTNSSKLQRYTCSKCGKEHVDKTNLLSKEKRKSLKK